MTPEKIERVHPINTPATPTATTDGKRVFVFFGSYGLICYDFEGDKKWEKTCLDTLITLNPEIEDHIILQDFISTSILAARFGKEGAGTGTAQSVDQVGKFRPKMVSPVKGLYYCSADAGGWGIGAELAARAALELFEIFTSNDFSNDKIFKGR